MSDTIPEIDLAAAGRAMRGSLEEGELEVAEIIAAPPPLALRLLLYALGALLAILLAWTYFGRYDVIVAVRGQLVPAAPLGIVQADRPARILRALVPEGARVSAGQPVIALVPLPGAATETVVAPVEGTIAGVSSRRPGELVGAGQKLAEVAPDGPLEARVEIPNADMGRARIGLPAKVKVDAFPYQEYGTLPGRLASVSSLPAAPESGPAGAPGAGAQIGPPPFSAEIALQAGDAKQRELLERLRPGLALTAELIVARRRILSLLLDRVRSH